MRENEKMPTTPPVDFLGSKGCKNIRLVFSLAGFHLCHFVGLGTIRMVFKFFLNRVDIWAGQQNILLRTKKCSKTLKYFVKLH